MHEATLLKCQVFLYLFCYGFSWNLSFPFAGNLSSIYETVTFYSTCESKFHNPFIIKDLLLKLFLLSGMSWCAAICHKQNFMCVFINL